VQPVHASCALRSVRHAHVHVHVHAMNAPLTRCRKASDALWKLNSVSRSTQYSSQPSGCGSLAGGWGRCVAASRHSRLCSHDSTGSPLAYLCGRAPAVGCAAVAEVGGLRRGGGGRGGSLANAPLLLPAGQPRVDTVAAMQHASHSLLTPRAHLMGSWSVTSLKVRPTAGPAPPTLPAAAAALPAPPPAPAACSRSCWMSFRDRLRPVPS
jgi:hypothetical protein